MNEKKKNPVSYIYLCLVKDFFLKKYLNSTNYRSSQIISIATAMPKATMSTNTADICKGTDLREFWNSFTLYESDFDVISCQIKK